MLLNILQNNFYHGIQIVQRAVSSKSTLPILTGIYLEAVKDKGLRLIANNLEMGIEYWVKADIKEEGAIVLPAAQLTNIIRELPSAEIFFEADLDHYQVNLRCLKSEFNIKGYQADEFPQLPEVDIAEKFVFKGENFKDMLEEVKFSVSTDQTQPSLTGGLMVINEKNINMVTTNTYRLAYSWFENKTDYTQEIEFILPGTSLNELSHLIEDDGELELMVGDSYVRFNFNEVVFISRLIEGKFPNYRQVIPGEYKTRVKVDREELLKAVRRVSLIARLDSNVISVEANKDEMHIKSINSEHGDAHEILEIEIEGSVQNIDIDAGYLIDVLKILKDEVVILELIGPLNPLTIKKSNKDDYIYLIMPVRPGA